MASDNIDSIERRIAALKAQQAAIETQLAILELVRMHHVNPAKASAVSKAALYITEAITA